MPLHFKDPETNELSHNYKINNKKIKDALCYYRFSRILQDIDEYCEYIFLSDEGGDDRMQVLEHLKPHFLPNGTIERAYHADKMRSIS